MSLFFYISIISAALLVLMIHNATHEEKELGNYKKFFDKKRKK